MNKYKSLEIESLCYRDETYDDINLSTFVESKKMTKGISGDKQYPLGISYQVQKVHMD